MPRNHQYDDEDMRNILKDGERMRVRMSDGLDPLQRAIAEHVAGGRTAVNDGQRIVDGFGRDGLHLYRPGHRLFADGQGDQSFYDAYDARISSAHKKDAGEQEFASRRVGDLCTVGNIHGGDLGEEGDRGTIQRVDGELCCVSDRYRGATGAEATSDALDMRDHATMMADIYSELDRELSNAWRGPAR
ncbi:MAG: hypothetical protein ACLP19_28420 [Xanthobacteraceae bacterium]